MEDKTLTLDSTVGVKIGKLFLIKRRRLNIATLAEKRGCQNEELSGVEWN